MTYLLPLDVESVVEMNVDLCAETEENSALLDLNGLEAALARPWSGFGDVESFPGLYEKAAAILHGIASRQVFENGNKRTAWVAAVTFLDVNGVDIGRIEAVHSDMFVRAAGLDHSLEIEDIAEWFEVTHKAARRFTFSSQRQPIKTAGGFVVEDGRAEPRGFQFVDPIDHEHALEIFTVDGITAGWEIEELHVVAHGIPCAMGSECPLLAVQPSGRAG